MADWQRWSRNPAGSRFLHGGGDRNCGCRECRGLIRRVQTAVRIESYERPTPCSSCGALIKPGSRGRSYCSNACRQKAYRARAHTA